MVRNLGMELGNLTPTMRRLIERGWVTETRSPTDQRVRVITLTDIGSALLQSARPQVPAVVTKYMKPLNGEERAELLRLLAKVADPVP